MKFSNQKQDKGIAGLTVFLSLIVMLFIIGLIVMIFALMGSEIQSSSTVATSADFVGTHETLTSVDEIGETLVLGGYAEGACDAVSVIVNGTDYIVISSGNYTQTNCLIQSRGGTVGFNNTDWLVNYTGTYGGESWDIINDTITGISGASDWFDIFIVIGAMVVLILLTVIIITAIRGSGLVAVGQSGGQSRNVGSA